MDRFPHPIEESLQCYKNSLDAIEKAAALVKIADSFSCQDMKPKTYRLYFVTINDLLAEAKRGLQVLGRFVKDEKRAPGL